MEISFEVISKEELSQLRKEAVEVPFFVEGVALRFTMARGRVLGVEFGDSTEGTEAPHSLILTGDFSPFRLEVYMALLTVERGSIMSYSALASKIGRPTAIRAVAHAVASNPFAYIIPCHRIVPATGAAGNYRWGSSLKVRLLRVEGVRI